MTYAFMNGEFMPLDQAKVGVMTHALHYGTSVFEGIRGNWNEEQEKDVRVPPQGALRAASCRAAR